MYEVLMAVDDSEERAVKQAKAVTDLPGSEEIHVALLHSFTDNPSGASASQVAAVRRAMEILEEAGVAIDLYEDSGDPSDAILDTAAEIGADIICVGGRKRSPAGKALFGSVAQRIILSSDRPVLVTGGASA